MLHQHQCVADTVFNMCLNPINAELQEFGKPKFTHEGALKLPCGKCTECKSQRAVQWAIRARHEIALHDENCFLTLTYEDKNLPSHLIVKDPFQRFMKRLRKHVKKPLRYMVSHEYGSQHFRPHHHAIIFGWNPKEQYEPRTTGSGEKIFRSKELEKLWTNGFSSVGTANERTAYYIASYALKGAKHEILLPNGEYAIVNDQFDCSRRPAIGLNYFINNQEYLVNSKDPMPRYYVKKLKEINPLLHERYENEIMDVLKTRSSHEMYAKYILDQHKVKNSSSEFRSTPEDTRENLYLESDLKFNRDEYHRHNKE